MRALFRALLVALSLLTGGVFELAAAVEAASCCEESDERDAPRPDCTAGALCACCPVSALPAHAHGVSGAATVAAGVAGRGHEPSLAAAVTDIFHPPRA